MVAEGVVVSQFDKVTAIRLLDDNPLLFDPKPSTTNNAQPSLSSSSPPSNSSTTTTASDDLQGRKVIFPDLSQGVVVAHRPPIVFVYSTTTTSTNNNINNNTADDTTKEEQQQGPHSGRVHILSSRMEILAVAPPLNNGNQELRGKVHSRDITTLIPDSIAATTSMDGSDEDTTTTTTTPTRALFAPIPQVKDISLINVPMLTGITMIDALSPIGRGQNMLFVGHNLNDMRRYAIDFLSNQIRSSRTRRYRREDNSESSSSSSNNNNNNVACVYAAIDHYVEVNELLNQQGIRDSVHVVAPSRYSAPETSEGKSEPQKQSHQAGMDEMTRSAEAVLVAATACALAESWAVDRGDHVVVVIDTLDWHKTLWDSTTRVLVDVFGIDAVVQGDREGGASSEMRAFYSTIIQRSAQYKAARGGGSITLLLLTQIPRIHNEVDDKNKDNYINNNNNQEETIFAESDFETSSDVVKERIKVLTKRNIPLTKANLRKIDIPIPSIAEGRRRLVLQHVDDLISMSDGQIWLDERLEQSSDTAAAAGQCPPLDPQRSFTRIGIGADTESRADAPALRRIMQGLRLILQQASSMEGAESNTASQKQVQRQQALLLAMHQTSGQGGRTLADSCAVLLAASAGYLDEAAIQEETGPGTPQGTALIQGLLDHLHETQPELMQEVDDSLDLQQEQKTQLLESIKQYLGV